MAHSTHIVWKMKGVLVVIDSFYTQVSLSDQDLKLTENETTAAPWTVQLTKRDDMNMDLVKEALK